MVCKKPADGYDHYESVSFYWRSYWKINIRILIAIRLIGTVMELNAPYTDGLQPHWLQKFGVRLVIGANRIR